MFKTIIDQKIIVKKARVIAGLILALSTILVAYAGHRDEISSKAEVVKTDPASTVKYFEKLFGITKGKRRNHTKGFCFDGTLIPTKAAEGSSLQKLSSSEIFDFESTVVGRLSHKGGNNDAADDSPAEYGLGLSITMASGDVQIMSMNTLDFFPVATPEAFAQLMHAKAAGVDAVKKFKAGNADFQRFKAHTATKPKILRPYEGSTYNSINSFYLVNENAEKTAVRWSFVPTTKQRLVIEPSDQFFFENLKQNLSQNEVAWNMVITVANTNDVVNNPALPWIGEHQTYIAAKLVINSLSSEEEGKCDSINFDPLVLAPGFEPSADPLLKARRITYAIGFGKRTAEK